MAEIPFFSSQGSEYEAHGILEDQENAASQRKPRKPPTVTPKRFKKFFTPRASISSTGRRQSKAGRQLRDITKNGANLRNDAAALGKPVFGGTGGEHTRPYKRRKRSVDLASSPPPQSSPLKYRHATEEIHVFEGLPHSPAFSDEDDMLDIREDSPCFPKPIQRLHHSGSTRRVLQRSFGGYDVINRGHRGIDHCINWRTSTADFASNPTDVHRFAVSTLPFCTASCNTNSLVAIGEEEGGVNLIDSSPSSDFSTAHVSFRPHNNAIMDIAFNSDDFMLATASGDQTSRIIDMHTQQTVCILSGHKSSVKRICFQPTDDNMLTTSSRDGSVLLWDLRCGNKGSIASLRTSFARNVDNGDSEPTVRYAKYTLDAGNVHRSTRSVSTRNTDYADTSGTSITAIQHLSNGREHVLLTTSEINSSIKVWDLRNVGRRSSNALLSSTPIPEHHRKTRNYGINAMALSGDGARLYTVCRDGVVYAYSTNHLVLDCTQDSTVKFEGKGRTSKHPQSGLGPLYGFRNPSMRMGTFYVKAAVRPARGDKSELLAVGSSDNCAVLFPTDEQHFPERERRFQNEDDDDNADLPTLPFPKSKSAPSTGIPIHEHGTALVRGHHKEVTSLTWSHEGELVTIGDDSTARCWREDGQRARELRGCGEGGGQRWACGWADLDPVWDEEEG